MRSEFDKLNEDDSESPFDFLNDGNGNPGDGAAGQARHTRPSTSRSERAEPGAQHKGTRSANDASRSSSRSGSGSKSRPGPSTQSSSSPYPVIRKPVRVQQSGPLRPPRPGDPIEPPPPLTTAARSPVSPNAVKSNADIDLDDLDLGLQLDPNDDWPSSDQWADARERPVPVNYQSTGMSVVRKLGYVFATCMVLTGMGAVLYSLPVVKQHVEEPVSKLAGSIKGLLGTAAPDADEDTPLALSDAELEAVGDPAPSGLPSSLFSRFQEQLTQLETLLDEGSLDEATTVLVNMDRAVYGYGSQEFAAIEDRLNNLKAGGTDEPVATDTNDANVLPQADVSAEQAATDAAILEEQRVVEEQAAAEVARLEEQRVAEEQAAEAARLEEQRVAKSRRQKRQAGRAARSRRAGGRGGKAGRAARGRRAGGRSGTAGRAARSRRAGGGRGSKAGRAARG